MNAMLDKLTPGLQAKLHLLLDLIMVVLAALLSQGVGQHLVSLGNWSTWSDALAIASAGVLGWMIASSVIRLYSPWTPRSVTDAAVLTIISAGATTLGLVALNMVLSDETFDPFLFGSVLAAGSVLTQVMMPAQRPVLDEEEVLIVGTGPLGLATFGRLTGDNSGRKVIGFLRFNEDPPLPEHIEAPLLGSNDKLLDVLEKRFVSEVYLAEQVITHGHEMQKMVKVLEELGLPFAVPLHSLRFNRALLMSTANARDGYLHYLGTTSRPAEWAVKRLLDIVLSTVALVLLSPVLLIVALVIKFSSPGPVFFRQTRVGLHGAHFNFLKFRSMVVNAEALKDELLKFNEQTGPAFKMQNDPRITRIGRFIRKYSIDELPQLINVLRGDMTIVGPRPPVPREVAQYKPWQRRRLSVRPGLTCYWQVGGRNEIGFDEWMLLDLRYVDHWTLAKDIQLILRTIPVVLLGRGAS